MRLVQIIVHMNNHGSTKIRRFNSLSTEYAEVKSSKYCKWITCACFVKISHFVSYLSVQFSPIKCYSAPKYHVLFSLPFQLHVLPLSKWNGVKVWKRYKWLYSTTFNGSVTWFTVYPKKYAHGFCFAVLCCGYTLTDFPISIRLTSLALGQSNDCPSASKVTLMNMDKYFMWIHYERLHNHNKAKHNKTVCIFLGIYCTTAVDVQCSIL